jgi:hypothetical protein
MKKFKGVKDISLAAIVALSVLGTSSVFTSCSKADDSFAGPENVATRATITKSGVISSNETWSSSNIYRLNGKVYVTNGATLTIQAGTTIKGVAKSNPDYASALIVTRGSKINAVGTATSPIIMTAENGTIGGWGGLVILGKAVTNAGSNQMIEGIDELTVPPGVDVYFGGSNNNDNSGRLSYVRVEYAGAAIAPTNELNAFTFGGVGRGTTLDHLQAYYGDDDSFEFFGGCVDAKYLVSTSPNDDNFDFDNGFTGRIQFGVATADANADFSGDPNGIECDNDASSSNATPITHPVLSNLTIVGTSNCQINGIGGNPDGYLYNGARFRRNTQYTLVNSIIYGYPIGIWNNTGNTFTFENNVIAACSNCFKDFSSIPSSNVCTSVDALKLTDPFGDYYDSNALKPTGGYAVDGNYYQHTDSWFTQTSYKGAVASGFASSWLRQGWIK